MRQVMRPKTTVYESCDRYGNKRTSKRLAKFAKGQESEKGAVKRLPFHCLCLARTFLILNAPTSFPGG